MRVGHCSSGRWTLKPVKASTAKSTRTHTCRRKAIRFGWGSRGDTFVAAVREVHATVRIENRTVVWMTFAGYDPADSPLFVFIHMTTDSVGASPHTTTATM